MAKIKSPGILIRISHLIVIQIIFVFSALALVLFYPTDDTLSRESLGNKALRAMASTSILANMIRLDSTGVIVDSQVVAEAKRSLYSAEYFSAIDLLTLNRKTGKDTIIHLVRRDEMADQTISGGLPIRLVLDALKESPSQNYLSSMSANGNQIVFYFSPKASDGDFALAVAINNDQYGAIKNNQAEVLFLLFLFSALISLLIINLISRGIKKPLSNLLEAFEKTAGGEEHYVAEEEGDKDIQGLARAFNKMSQSLAEKQRKLTAANKELLKANRAIAESESILTALVDYSPDAVIVTDLEDQVIIYNQQAARDFGYGPSDMLGKKISNMLVIPPKTKAAGGLSNDSLEGKEIICRRRDGGRFPSLLVHTALGPEGGKPMAMLYFIKNISESRNYQNMILKLDRIASRGKMARDIAHEINNYLAVLQGNLELLPMILEKGDNEKILKKIGVMRETVGKISNFTDGLTQFSDEDSEFRKEDLNQLVENLVAFLKPQNRFDEILIGTNLADNLPLVEIDASQIQLLLVNLIYNAAESLANFDGTRWIIISTSLDESSGNVCLKVADSGNGVSPENIGRLFVSRFSGRKGGNGLGLITCKNIVDNHRGEISYHSGDESKAIFIVKIPINRSDKKDETPGPENAIAQTAGAAK
jgi:PAS domain S-box-containing protein